jgi:hypothetical protein
MPCCTTQPCPTSAAPSARHRAPDVRHGQRIGAGAGQHAGRPERLAQHVLGANDAKTFLAEHSHHGAQQAVVAAECGTADAGQDASALGIGAVAKQGWAAHRTDQHKVLGAERAQGRQDAAGVGYADHFVRPGGQHRRVGAAFQPDHENPPPGRLRCDGDLARQWATAGQYSQCAWCRTVRGGEIHSRRLRHCTRPRVST